MALTPHTFRSPRGFTLIEVMLVVAIAGIMAVLAVGGMRGNVQKQRARVAAEEVGAALIEARNLARKRVQCVQVDINANAMLMEAYDTCTGLDIDGLGTPVLGSVVESITRSFPPTVALQDFSGAVTGTTIHFNPRGGLPYVAAVELVVQDTALAKDIRRFRILPAIGSVKREKL